MPGQGLHLGGITQRVIGTARHHLFHSHAMEQGKQVCQDDPVIRRKFRNPADFRQQPGAIPLYQGTDYPLDVPLVDGTQHITDIAGAEVLVAKGDGLVGQAQGIPHTAVGCPGQQPQGRLFKRNGFFCQDVFQVADNVFRRHPFEVELQTAGQHGNRQFLGIGGGQQELHVLRRLFQGFQKRVEGLVGEHVHLVDEVHLEPATTGCVLNVIGQFAHVIHAGAGCGVDFDKIDKPAFQDLLTAVTFAARVRGNAGFTVKAPGQQAANGGFTHTPGTGEQIRMVQALVFQCVNKCLQHVLLPNHVFKRTGAPFPG